MTDIHPYRPNALAGSPLDRAGTKRNDTAWIETLRADPGALFVPVWRSRNLVRLTSDAATAVYVGAAAVAHAPDTAPWAFLGVMDEVPVFAIDLSPLDKPLAGVDPRDFDDLRRMGSLLPAAEASLLAHARGLMHWRTRNRFCGVCGGGCLPRSAGHALVCQGCGAEHFPRTDPAVIMLVTDGERVLLGQPARFRGMRLFTTLAGFVEPGESLEEAVAREVFEEAAIRVANVRYHSSQPCPFPASIMLGFTAEARSTDITVDPEEIIEARWFTRGELRQPEGFVMPPDFSIARRLINDWIAG